MTISTDQLAEWQRLADKATAGPWDHGGSVFDGQRVTAESWVWELTGHAAGDPDAPDTRICCAPSPDAAFIAASRTAVPALIADIRAKDAEIHALRKWVRRLVRKRHYVCPECSEDTFDEIDHAEGCALAAVVGTRKP